MNAQTQCSLLYPTMRLVLNDAAPTLSAVTDTDFHGCLSGSALVMTSQSRGSAGAARTMTLRVGLLTVCWVRDRWNARGVRQCD